MRTSLASLAAALLLVGGAGVLGTPPAAAGEPPAPQAGPPAPPAAPAPLLLRTAVERGLLDARGGNPDSYRSIRLELVNRGTEPVEVDLCGSYLKPETGSKSCQRLGLGPVITPGPEFQKRPGAVVVTVAAASTLQLHVATVCLDSSKPCPSNQAFVASGEALPSVREKVMRWWADHPEAPQGAVNSAIWRNAPEVDLAAWPAAAPARPSLRGTVRGGTSYLLRDDALLVRDPDGVERFLATGIDDVFPVDGALYAVARVGAGRELWRYVETGDELWKRVAPVPADTGIVRLDVLPGGALLASTASKLLRLAPGESAFQTVFELPERASDLSFQVQPRNRLRVSFLQPPTAGTFKAGEQEHARSSRCELWSIDLSRSRPAEQLKLFWNVAVMAQGPTRTFGLTNAGSLRVLRGESFHDHPGPDLEKLVHVGREHLWALERGGALVCLRFDRGAMTRIEAPFTSLQELRFDDAVDAAAVRRGALVRVSAATGAVTVVEPAPTVAPAPR